MTSVSHAEPRRASADPPTTAGAPPTTAEPPRVTGWGPVRRLRVAAAGLGAAVLGAAPHVLHHAGLLGGAAIFAGLGAKLIFAAIGLVATTPLLLKMRRRTNSWHRPAAALAFFGTLFALSSFVVAPALTGARSDDDRSPPASASPGMNPSQHHP